MEKPHKRTVLLWPGNKFIFIKNLLLQSQLFHSIPASSNRNILGKVFYRMKLEKVTQS